MAKLDHKQIAIGFTVTSLISIPVSGLSVMLANDAGLEISYRPAMTGFWLVSVGYPALFVSIATLRRILGEKASVRISAAAQTSSNRMVPINGGQGGFLAMEKTIKAIKSWGQQDDVVPPLPSIFLVENITWSANMEPITLEFTEAEVSDFLYTAWRRQIDDDIQASGTPFSRTYFTRMHRPKLRFSEYYGLMTLIENCGLVANRRQGKSGKLIMPPNRGLKQIKYTFGLL